MILKNQDLNSLIIANKSHRGTILSFALTTNHLIHHPLIMDAEIITIGNELISGSTVDSNAAFMAESLMGIGIEVGRMTSVGDSEESISKAIKEGLKDFNLLFITGGLGPTADDITRDVIAKTIGRRLILDKEALQDIKRRFEKIGFKMTPNNERQAFFPEGSEIIPNPLGTACGFKVCERDGTVYVLPGVPREMKGMLKEVILPSLQKQYKEKAVFLSSTLKMFGISESKIDEILQGLEKEVGVTLAFLPHIPEIDVKITAKSSTREEAEAKISLAEKKIRDKLGSYIFAKNDQSMEGVVGELLRKKGATLSVAESCTGGLITHRLTNVPGSSDYLNRGVVVYSNQAKIDLLGVPEEIIEKFGAVSEKTAESMAKGIREKSNTTFGLAVTGIAGPDGGTPQKPVGTVFISLSSAEGTKVKGHKFWGGREQIKLLTSEAALDLLRKHLLQ